MRALFCIAKTGGFLATDGLDARVPSLLHTYTSDLFSGPVWYGYLNAVLHVKCVAPLLSTGFMVECVCMAAVC